MTPDADDIDDLLEQWSAGADPLAARRIAMHPQAPTETLVELAYSEDDEVRRLVASNAQTPLNLLRVMAVEFPGEFFMNPAFDLMLVEEPTLLERLPPSIFRHILKRDDCPAVFLEWASVHGSESLQTVVANRSHISRDILIRVAQSRHPKAAELAANRLLTLVE